MSNSQLNRALSAMKSGDLERACTLFDQSIGSASDPKALLQAAVCYRATNRLEDALTILRDLDERGENTPPALLLRADIFCSLNRHQHALLLYRELADIEETSIAYPTALGLFKCGQVESARRLSEKLMRANDVALISRATILLGRCMAATEKYDAANDTFASVKAPKQLRQVASYRLARLQLHRGAFDNAEEQLRTLLTENAELSGARETLLQTLIHSGQINKIHAEIRNTADTDRNLAWLRHVTDFLIEQGDPNYLEPLSTYWQRSQTPEIFREYLSRLLSAGDHQSAKTLLEEYSSLRSSDDHWRWGTTLWLRENKEHEALLSFVEEGVLKHDLLESACIAHFALGHYAQALDLAQRLCREAPGDQHFLAMLVTALRCLEDPRYSALVDPSRMIAVLQMQTPEEGKPGDTRFWETIAADLDVHHSMVAAPQMQSVRQGIQTPGNLLTQTAQPTLIQLKTMIERACQQFFQGEWLTQLAEPHPVRMFRPKHLSMHASWGIRGQAGTYHQSHVHSKGWYSGTCYIEVPEILNGAADAGCLIFGEPPFETKDSLPPAAVIQPIPGRLVLFPSYFWHGTRTYSGEGFRQVVAFDFGTPNRFV